MGLAVGAACIALAVFLPGIGTVAAGALLGAGMGAISASVAGAVSDYSSGNVRSLGEATKDMVISMITGAITGAIGAAFPAMKWFGEGLIDVGSGILTRGMYALLNPDMSTEEKLAYVFDLKQMGVDFITGVAMHFAFKGVSAVREKIFFPTKRKKKKPTRDLVDFLNDSNYLTSELRFQHQPSNIQMRANKNEKVNN